MTRRQRRAAKERFLRVELPKIKQMEEIRREIEEIRQKAAQEAKVWQDYFQGRNSEPSIRQILRFIGL